MGKKEPEPDASEKPGFEQSLAEQFGDVDTRMIRDLRFLEAPVETAARPTRAAAE